MNSNWVNDILGIEEEEEEEDKEGEEEDKQQEAKNKDGSNKEVNKKKKFPKRIRVTKLRRPINLWKQMILLLLVLVISLKFVYHDHYGKL